jgi:hypothetical protein
MHACPIKRKKVKVKDGNEPPHNGSKVGEQRLTVQLLGLSFSFRVFRIRFRFVETVKKRKKKSGNERAQDGNTKEESTLSHGGEGGRWYNKWSRVGKPGGDDDRQSADMIR